MIDQFMAIYWGRMEATMGMTYENDAWLKLAV
jgi:hypothetical protein